jgi:hypothetical protein
MGERPVSQEAVYFTSLSTILKASPPQLVDRCQGKSLGLASMVVGISGIAPYWLPWVNLICPAASIVLGAMGLQKSRQGTVTPKLPAVTGLLLGGLLLFIGLFVIEVAGGLAAVPVHSGEAFPG